MITRIPSVLQFNPARFWTPVVWFFLSGWLVQSANTDYGHVPMYFVENHGQFQGQAKYVARGSRLTGDFGRVCRRRGKLPSEFSGGKSSSSPGGYGAIRGPR
jgi:hypothetical protein